MKSVINGLRYDTTTAELIGEASSSAYSTDFRYWEEELYRTRRGRWFLAGKGGPSSHYAVSVGNNGWGGGQRITPLTEAEAQAWAERHLDADTVAQHFSTEEA